MEAGVTLPLGARPSVGAGLWLQGGIGHLARLHGLSCDAIIGAVVVSVDSGQVLCIGRVPSQHRPTGAVSPENEAELLWATRGVGTNFGIVVSVTFKAYTAPTHLTRNWVIPLRNDLEARLHLSKFDNHIAGNLPRNCSADEYLYWDVGRLHLGVTMFESSTTGFAVARPTPTPTPTPTPPRRWRNFGDRKIIPRLWTPSDCSRPRCTCPRCTAGTAAARPPHSSDVYS